MRALIRVLAIGFTAVIVFLAAAAFIGARNARSISQSASALVTDQLVITNLLDEVEQEQGILNASFYRLSRNPETVDRTQVVADLDKTDREIQRLVDQAGSGPDYQLWQTLRKTTLGFSAEARELLNREKAPAVSSRDLFFRHEAVTRAVADLVGFKYDRARETEQRVTVESNRLAEESTALVGGALVLALGCALVTMRIAARVVSQMQAQSGELSRVSFRLLQVQEEVARRFAHELHDELGGSLTAIKSDLMALAADPFDKTRLEDSVKLVEQSISNVRELSQLLRPTILDDFGLDASLRWLVARFGERTGIEVEYKSTFDARLPDQTETHLFRIVQEALTNIARHAQATRVSINLRSEDGAVRLSISDNGRGIAPESAAQNRNGNDGRKGGMGISGMRARAASAGGDLKIESKSGGGVAIEVWAPLAEPRPVEPQKEFT
jgi:signal transduction histidine kinase